MTVDQEQLEQKLQNVEDFMLRMSSMMETLVQNQGQRLRLTVGEQAEVLRSQLQNEREKATAELATGGANAANQEEESANRSDAETCNPRS